jgi:hypothetical protein
MNIDFISEYRNPIIMLLVCIIGGSLSAYYAPSVKYKGLLLGVSLILFIFAVIALYIIVSEELSKPRV